MSEPKPYQIAVWISQEILSTEFFPLRSVIDGVLRQHIQQLSDESIAELAESLENAVFDQLGIITDQLLREGTEPTFFLEGDPGSAYIKTQNVKAIKLLSHLREIDPIEFEKFCAEVLKSLGAKARNVGRTNDGGVDFIATDIPISYLDSPAIKPAYPLLIGQAKRYKENNLVTVTDMRCFLGGAFVIADEIKKQEERYGLFSPVIYAYWTTSDFNVSARKFSLDTGLWCLGGLALSQLAFRLNMEITQKI